MREHWATNYKSLNVDAGKLSTAVAMLNISGITLNNPWLAQDKEEKCLLLIGAVKDAELLFVGGQMSQERSS